MMEMDRHGYLFVLASVGGQINRLRRCQGSIASRLNLAFQRAASASTTVDIDSAYESLIRPLLSSLQTLATRHQTRQVGNAESRGLRWVVRPAPSFHPFSRKHNTKEHETTPWHARVSCDGYEPEPSGLWRGLHSVYRQADGFHVVKICRDAIQTQSTDAAGSLKHVAVVAQACSIPLPRSPFPPSRTIYEI